MPQAKRARVWLSFALAAAVFIAISTTAGAKESSVSVKEAEQYVAKGDLKAAEIELKNAIRQSPQDPILRARLAQVYLQLGDAGLAEREARAARERNGDEADYLPILAEALLQQQHSLGEPLPSLPADLAGSPALTACCRRTASRSNSRWTSASVVSSSP